MSNEIFFDDEYISPVVLFVAAVVGGLCFFLAYISVDSFTYGVAISVDLIVLICFYSCRITVTQDVVLVRYGIGLFRRVFPRHSVAELKPVPNVRPTAWIYRPFAESSLLILLRSGKLVALPAVMPRQLAQCIKVEGKR